jgi:ADP-ribose pyrophosphatase YjhB (NUDIX family)
MDALPHFPITTVGALIFNRAREVLMIRTHKWSNLWGIPGGKIKWGETAEDALRREIREETALEITNIQFALVQDCIRSKEFHREAHFVLLNYTCDTSSTAVVLNDEAEHFQWLSPQAALTLELNTPTRILMESTKGKAWK